MAFLRSALRGAGRLVAPVRWKPPSAGIATGGFGVECGWSIRSLCACRLDRIGISPSLRISMFNPVIRGRGHLLQRVSYLMFLAFPCFGK